MHCAHESVHYPDVNVSQRPALDLRRRFSTDPQAIAGCMLVPQPGANPLLIRFAAADSRADLDISDGELAAARLR